MGIPEYHFFHGAALSLIAGRGEFTGLRRREDFGSGAYAINDDVGLYLKHSTSESSPWRFNFAPEHQVAVRDLFKRYDKRAFVALVCGPVGVCLLTYGQYAAALDENFADQEHLIIERRAGGGFRVHGAAGKVAGVIPLNRFPSGLFERTRRILRPTG